VTPPGDGLVTPPLRRAAESPPEGNPECDPVALAGRECGDTGGSGWPAIAAAAARLDGLVGDEPRTREEAPRASLGVAPPGDGGRAGSDERYILTVVSE
jgi:hypothetical protein